MTIDKKYIIMAVFAMGFVLVSTTIYVPAGYTAVTHDSKSLYSEGVHLFQTHPFEYFELTKISQQCDQYDNIVGLNDKSRIKVHMNVCWHIVRDINEISNLNKIHKGGKYKIAANPVQGGIKSLYGLIDRNKTRKVYGKDLPDYETDLVYLSTMQNVYITFNGFNASNLDPYNFNISGDILAKAQRDLDDAGIGIAITEVTVSLPSFEPFIEAIKKRNEIKEQAENEAKRIQEEARRQYS